MIDTLRTLFRATRAEKEDALIDANAIPLLAQHLRDAKADAGRARQALATLMGRRKSDQARIGVITSEITRREAEARIAIEAAEDALVDDIADRIASLEDERSRISRADAELTDRINALRSDLSDTERRIAILADELRLARSQSMHRAAGQAVDASASGSALRKAEETAERLKANGARIENELAAMKDIEGSAGNDLDTRIKDAGLDKQASTRRNAILDRIRNTEKPS